MKNFIIWLLIAFAFFGSIIYFVFSSDKSLSITYIKFNINPEFIIGINSNDQVKIYNPLNDDAKVLNLNMFNGYSLEKTIDVILNKLEENNYLDIEKINITVITKSNEKIKYYYDKISSIVKEKDNEIVLVNDEASHDELLAYSNEVSYDIKPSFNNETLKSISNDLKEQINNYVNNLITELNIEELEVVDKIDVISQMDLEGYFDNFDLINYQFNNGLKIKPGSNYKVNFSYNDEGYTYDIELYLILEYFNQMKKEEITYQTIEEYYYTFKNNEIYGLKNNFYKFQ